MDDAALNSVLLFLGHGRHDSERAITLDAALSMQHDFPGRGTICDRCHDMALELRVDSVHNRARHVFFVDLHDERREEIADRQTGMFECCSDSGRRAAATLD